MYNPPPMRAIQSLLLILAALGVWGFLRWKARPAGRQRLNQRHGRAFVARRVHHDIQISVHLVHLVFPAVEAHHAGQAQALATPLKQTAFLPVADQRHALVVPDLRNDARFARHPLTSLRERVVARRD